MKTTFPPEKKWILICAVIPIHAAHFFIELEYLDNPQTILEFFNSFREN